MNTLENSWFEVVEDPKLTTYSESDSPATQSDSDEDSLAQKDSEIESPDTSVGSMSSSDEENSKLTASFVTGAPKLSIIFLALLLFLTPVILCQFYFFRKAISSLQTTYASKFASYDRYLTRNEYATKTLAPGNQAYDRSKGFSSYFGEENRKRLLAVDADHVIVIRWPSFIKTSYFQISNSLTSSFQSSKIALKNIKEFSRNRFVALTKTMNSKNWNYFTNFFNKKGSFEQFSIMVANLKKSSKTLTIKGSSAFKNFEMNMTKALISSKNLADSCRSHLYASWKASSTKTATMSKIIGSSTWKTIRDGYKNFSKRSLKAVNLGNTYLFDVFKVSSKFVRNNAETLSTRFGKFYSESNKNLRSFLENKYSTWNEPITVCKKGFFSKSCIQREKTLLEKFVSLF